MTIWYTHHYDYHSASIGIWTFYDNLQQALTGRLNLINRIEHDITTEIHYDGEVHFLEYSNRVDLVNKLNEIKSTDHKKDIWDEYNS